jgi:nucleoside-diphosphate-sugar epimerase
MEGMKAAVFGASGFVGRHLAAHLATRGWDVRPILRGDESWRSEALGHVFFCVGLTADFRTRPFETIDAHVGFAVEVLRAARFDSFLYCSSTRVYAKCGEASETTPLTVDPADPSDLYNLSKLMGEAACLAVPRSEVRVARLSNIMGADPGSDNFLTAVAREAVRDGKVVLGGAPASAKDYIAADEAVAAMARIAADGRERVYNIASGRNTTHAEVAAALSAATGCLVETAPGAAASVFPVINVARMAALGLNATRTVADLMPDLVAAMRADLAIKPSPRDAGRG